MFENFDDCKSGTVKSPGSWVEESLSQPGFPSEKRSKEYVGVNDDARWVHNETYPPKRSLFFDHQSAFISSDNRQASPSVSLLRRAMLSTRSQLTKSFT